MNSGRGHHNDSPFFFVKLKFQERSELKFVS